MVAVRQVELDEEDASDAEPRPRRSWWWLVAVVLVGAVLVGGQAWLDARHRVHEARFDDVAGVLLPVPPAPDVRWVVDQRDQGLLGAVQVGSHLVSGYVDGGRYTVRELDRVTGRARWTATGDATPATADAVLACRALGDADRVVCAAGGPEPYSEADRPAAMLLLVLDATDGALVSARPERAVLWTASDGHIVTATSTTAGDEVTWSLRAHDATGNQTWARTLEPIPVRQTSAATVDTYFPEFPLRLAATGDRVLLNDQGHVWVLDAGQVTSQRDVEAGTTVDLLPGGVVQLNPPPAPDASTDPGTTLVLLDGTETHVSGWPLVPSVDDGSADGLVLVQQTPVRFAALDARTGRTRWSLPVTNVGEGLVLGGTLYVNPASHTGADVEGPTLDAVDLRTGRSRWSRPVVATGTPATDGRAVYLTGAPTVQAFSIDDGTALPTVSMVDPHDALASDASYAGWGAWLGLLLRSSWDDAASTSTVSVLG